MKEELQNSDLLKGLSSKKQNIVKFTIRAVTESGKVINIKQPQLNDICYDIVVKPHNRKINFNSNEDIREKAKKVHMYNIDGTFEKEFKSASDAQYAFSGLTSDNLRQYLNTSKFYFNKIWLWEEESLKMKLSNEFYFDNFGMSRQKFLKSLEG